MDQTSRAQVRLVLEDLVIRTKQAVNSRLKAIYAERAATSSLLSGATIKSVVTTIEEMAAEFITRCVDQVAPIAKDVEAFAMMQEAVGGLLRFLAGRVDDAVRMATGGGSAGQIAEAARAMYGASQEDLRRQLEIHRFTFTVPQTPPVSLGTPPAPAAQKNRGGKPRAAHWDEMWAEIAVMLYAGDLQPKTQADIERAMKDWLVGRDLDVGDTAVRDRARQLWVKLRDAE